MKSDADYPQESLSLEDWQSLVSFFELLIKTDKENKKELLTKPQ